MVYIFLLVTSAAVQRLVLGVSKNSDSGGASLTFGPCFLDILDPCNSEKILFYLYTRESHDNPVKLFYNDTRIPPEYNVTAKTKILIHGYAGSVNYYGIVALRKAFQEKGNYNVVVVDWGELAKLPCYPFSVVNTLQAGRCTALMLSNLASFHQSNSSDFHAIGFSLGSHVAAFASNEFERIRGKQLDRISGLDPALPFFASLEKSWKLDREDALFVDVIHTNVGIFGKIEATGHVDFYVNKGVYQPACNHSPNIPLCSHNMALIYFAESINSSDNEGFWGIPCSNYFEFVIGTCKAYDNETKQILMGEYCDRDSRGMYFVLTRDKPPYALGRIQTASFHS